MNNTVECSFCHKILKKSSLKAHQKKTKYCLKIQEENQTLDHFNYFDKLPIDIQKYCLEFYNDNILFTIPIFRPIMISLAKRYFKYRIGRSSNSSFDSNILYQMRHKKICLTKAKNLYNISNHNLSLLRYDEAPNPYYRSSHNMKLYNYADVLSIAIIEYGSIEACENALIERVEKRIKRREQQQAKKLKETKIRKKNLQDALKNRGLVLRSDSNLCKGYIDKKDFEEWTLEMVVQRMAEMKYLFEYCNMRNKIKQLRNEYDDLY